MTILLKRIWEGLILKVLSIAEPTVEGSLYLYDDSGTNRLKLYRNSAAHEIADLDSAQDFTNKTVTSPVINTGVSGTAIDTDGTFAADSDTLLASQKATKTYVDAQVAGKDEASEIIFDPASSTLTSINVQDAIDEEDVKVQANASNITDIETKTDFITVTQAVDLDSMESDITTNATSISDHIADATAAHAASAIANTPSGNLVATDVQGALNELQTELDGKTDDTVVDAHIIDAVGAHAASAVSVVASGNLAAIEVQAALDEHQGDIDSIETDVTNIETKTDFITVTQAVDLDAMESGISTNAGNISTNAGDITTLEGEFNTSTGHDHDGTDSKKVLGSNLDSTGGSNNQVLLADGSGGISWAGVPGSAPSFTTVTKTSSTTLATSGEDSIIVDTTLGNIVLTLPAASGNNGLIYRITNKVETIYHTIIDGNLSETINGEPTFGLHGKDNEIQIACDGVGWYSISGPSTRTAYIKDEKGSGTAGGTFTAGSWLTRDLTALSGDTTFISLSANQFTLPAGKYDIEASAPAYATAQHKIKLRDITNSVDIIIGQNSFSVSSGTLAMNESSLFGAINITVATTFEIQHESTVSHASGFGIALFYGVNEVYTQVKITKIL